MISGQSEAELAAQMPDEIAMPFYIDCGYCKGTGEVHPFDPRGLQHTAETCTHCDGYGNVRTGKS